MKLKKYIELLFALRFALQRQCCNRLFLSPVLFTYPRRDQSLIMHFDSRGDISDEYLTVAQLSARYPAFSQGSIRWLIFNSKTNGFSKVITRIGRKIVINLSEFKKFMQNAGNQ